MAHKYQWSAAKYKLLVKGGTVVDKGKKVYVEGLRSLARGFDSKDGFDLRDVGSWTPAQRKRVRTFAHRLERIQAQAKRPMRARGENLRRLQEAFHGDIPSKDFKVAFVPDTEPKLTLPGAKRRPPRVRVLKEGVSIKRAQYERLFIPFDQKAMVKNARAEIKRVADQMPDAKLFYVRVGEYDSLTGKSLGLVTEQVLNWMQQYDGKRELPKTSGNRGDDPKHHHWKKWLQGLVGFVIPQRVDIRKLGRIIQEGRRKNAAAVEVRKRMMRRRSV